jgi:TPP-dependent pyruvate/acetoin dehydrogenase alpha subunit
LENTKSIGPVEAEQYGKLGLRRDRLLWMLRKMIEIRRFEERVERLFLQEGFLIGPSYLT